MLLCAYRDSRCRDWTLTDDGRDPIDDNACENAINPFRRRKTGRRNWLFAEAVGGANSSANLYSPLKTCVANGIDGYQTSGAPLVELPKVKTGRGLRELAALAPGHGRTLISNKCSAQGRG